MPLDLETIKNIASIATPLTTALIDTWIKPKLSKLYQQQKTDRGLLQHAILNKFEEYLIRCYEAQSYINNVVFQNQQKRLEEIYIPLKLRSSQNEEIIKIDDYKEEFIPTYKRVLITDTAGMGKSTIMKYLFLCCINKNKGIPIFLELRKLASDKPLLDIIYRELNPIDEEFDKDFVLRLIKRGDFIFFFDGYDEIPFNHREDVTRDLHDFIAKANNNCFVITSRPESSLASFPDFRQFSIELLRRSEAFELIKKYDKYGMLSSEIIAKLEGDILKNIKEFLTNPLLVSLLYKSYEYKATIPFKKHIFYRQVYDSLFESHDLTKFGGYIREKHSRLDIEDFHRVLRTLGFITVKIGQIEFDKDTLLALLREARSHSPGLDFRESDFLRDLITTVPLFIREGDYYRWSHKSIQEYFAAQFICLDTKGNQDAILRAMYRSNNNEKKYMTVMELCYDIDYKSFRRTVIHDLISEFEQYYDSSYTQIDRVEIKEEHIHRRKLLTFGMWCVVFSRKESSRLTKMKYDRVLQTVRDIAKKEGILEKYHNDAIVFLPSDNRIAFLFVSHVIPIMDLLHRKNEEIIHRRVPSQSCTKFIDRTLFIDDHPDSEANKRLFFRKVNSFLLRVDIPHMNPDKCKQVKLEIEAEMDKERSAMFLTSGI